VQQRSSRVAVLFFLPVASLRLLGAAEAIHAASKGFQVSIENSDSFLQVGWECGAVASESAFQLLKAGESFRTSWNSVQSQYKWLEQQDANGSIEYNTRTLSEGSRQTMCNADGPCRTAFLGDEEVSYLYERASSSTRNK